MSNLPITANEYENSVLVADFIRKAREVFNADSEITDFRFTPEINGCKITYVKGGNTLTVSLRLRKYFGGMKIV